MKDLKLLFPEILIRFVIFLVIMSLLDLLLYDEFRVFKNILIWLVLIPFVEIPRIRDTRRTLAQIGVDLNEASQLNTTQQKVIQTQKTPKALINAISEYDLIKLEVLREQENSLHLEHKRPWFYANDIITIAWKEVDLEYTYEISSKPKYAWLKINPDHGRAHYNLKIIEDILLDNRSIFCYAFND